VRERERESEREMGGGGNIFPWKRVVFTYWVAPRVGLDVLDKWRFSCPCRNSKLGPSSPLRIHCTGWATRLQTSVHASSRKNQENTQTQQKLSQLTIGGEDYVMCCVTGMCRVSVRVGALVLAHNKAFLFCSILQAQIDRQTCN